MGAWQDRYQTPTVEGLLGELGPEARLFAERAILALGRKPKPAWIVPWHWALSFDHPRGPVYLIPEPGRVRLVARLTRPAFEQMLAPKSARQARDAVLNASCVGESVWTDWAISSESVCDAVLRVVQPE